METVTINNKEPELREDYIKKLDEIEKQPSIHIGTVESLKNHYKKLYHGKQNHFRI